MQKQARQIEALEGIGVSASLTGVVQQVNGRGAAEGERDSRASYRGDVAITLPGGEMGDVEGKIFAHLRFGQGRGVQLRPTYTSTPNTTAFQTAASPDDAYAIVAEAWYQLTVPLPAGGFKPDSRERLEITAGKMDPFLFFDQNAAADDETARFLNNAFVHNPLLDSGGDVGADSYGFSPGVRVAYVSERDKPDSWEVSLGVFGSGPGADLPARSAIRSSSRSSRRRAAFSRDCRGRIGCTRGTTAAPRITPARPRTTPAGASPPTSASATQSRCSPGSAARCRAACASIAR
jgi:hypothetical protein